MADNLLEYNKAWYPQDAEDFHEKVFMKTLQKDNPLLYERVSKFFKYERFMFKTERMTANLSALTRLAEFEERKEENLMNDIFQRSNYSAKSTGEKIKLINEMYQARNLFMSNIKKIQGIKGNKGGGRIDPTSEFSKFLSKQIGLFVDQNGVTSLTEDDLKECVTNALYELLGQSNKEGDKLYAELAHSLDKLKGSNVFGGAIDELFAIYFGTTIRDIQKKLLEDPDITLHPEDVKRKVWGDYLFGSKKGNVLEVVEQLTLNVTQDLMAQDKASVYRTGASGMKADNIVTYKISTDLSELFSNTETEKTRSVRARSVDLLEQMFSKIGAEGGYIVEISDKNYSLTSENFAENKGFAAQTNFKLNNFDNLLAKMKVSSDIRSSLMFVLANIDEKLVGGEATHDICKYIATYLGYFLFDDLQITESMDNIKTQAIHLFNLDGIYIPLSVFLRAALYAFSKAPSKISNYVNVQFNSKFKYKKQTDGLQEEDWTKLYNERITESSLDVHFFGDFVDFIKQNVQL